MSEKKDNWERLMNIPDDYEYDPEIAQRAIEQIEREKAQKQVKGHWFKRHWRPMAVSLATCAVALAVFIPVYHSFFQSQLEVPPNSSSDSSSTIYFEEKQLTVESVTDVATFVQTQGLALKYFNYPTAITHSAVVTDTNQFAFLKQEMLYIGADGFDQVNLWSVVMTDADFDFAKFFNNLTGEITVSDIKVDYMTREELDSLERNIQAKFTYQSVDYYLEIVTEGEAEAKIEQFVNLLID